MNNASHTERTQSAPLSTKAVTHISRTMGVQSGPLAQMLLEQLYRAGITPGCNEDPEAAARGINDLVRELAPVNALEATLITQLCAAHILSMKELAAAAKTRFDESKTLHYNLAAKLQRTYLAQLDALVKLRGTRQMRVSVDQVSQDTDGTTTRTQLYEEKREANR